MKCGENFPECKAGMRIPAMLKAGGIRRSDQMRSKLMLRSLLLVVQ